ncbi:hypothetical protein [Bacillus thuringiensis]|uniref:hypothetical protein n=1 Tax=Bacillus thuringiensis TaxID=1428 RepID=UPI002D802ECB|nr:hypothetical protein [Bacillus thuringiensis]MEB4819579.1 hypothetical protein [Bacillus thuringiensis]
MKTEIDLNSILCKIIEEYEQVHTIGAFNFKKIDDEFFLNDIDYGLLNLFHLSKKDVINKNLKDICINQTTASLLYSTYQAVWKSNLANVFIISLNNTLYCCILKTIKNEEVGKVIRGYCVPISHNGEWRVTDSLTTFSRNDFI